MLFPKVASRMMSVWSETFLRPILLVNDASAAKTNGARAKTTDSNGKSDGAAAQSNGRAAKPNGAVAKTNGILPPPEAGAGAPATAANNGLVSQAIDYWFDRMQRSWLLLDVMRERGNAKLEHSAQGKPALLTFDSEMILDGRTFDRPANYALLKVKPRAHMTIDPKKRPYVIVDPRAGHGPGVGGFKEDSQIGMAMRSGHQCYLVTFFPEPVPGQTIADVHHVETIFVHHVRQLHADANKPVVVGNCQGGWAVAILCAGAPEDFGPIMLTGAPLSYWAGAEGDSPLRFLGGLIGGSWSLSLVGDIGNGRFDGANLVSNFELMNPGNSFWSKNYSLFRNIDTEAKRFLEFERWWGSFFLSNIEEVRFIVNELFTSNKLGQGRLQQEAGADPIDLRNIKSPIIVFCSWGDNITPPAQALHWILDTYPTDQDLLANEQTIIYMLHDKVGHLGIFVSGDVNRKQHAEVVRTLEMVEMLPPGLYEMTISDTEPGHADDELIAHRYSVKFAERKLQDIRDMGGTPKDQKPFEAAARLSQINEGLYLKYLSPIVRAIANEPTAALMRDLHPERVRQYIFSDQVNPAMRPVKGIAEMVRKNRRPVGKNNVFVDLEQALSDSIVRSWDLFRDTRDASQEVMFNAIFGQPLVQRALGVREDRAVGRGDEAERRARLADKMEKLVARDLEGGTLEAFVRICAYVHKGQPAAEERGYKALKQIYEEAHEDTRKTLVEFKDAVREQTFLVRLNEQRALETLPLLLTDHEHRLAVMHALKRMEKAMGTIDADGEARIRRVEEILEVLEPAVLAVDDTPALPAS
jgi:pimeloyl-ACP methyl ester carboxylesterase